MGRLDGRVAVVTGSGQGIGRAVAMLLAHEGARVVTNSRSPVSSDGTPTASDTAAEIEAAGGTSTAVFADVSRLDGCAELIDRAVDAYGTVDILVNNAGAPGAVKPVAELSDDEWTGGLALNLTSQFGCSRSVIPAMQRAGWGRIVNVSSNVGLYGLAQMTPYAAAKSGTFGLTFALAKELADTGITVNCVMPTSATVRTERTRAERQARTGHVLPASPLRIPEAVAPLVAYLCGEACAGITGQVLYSAGGQITHYAWPPTPRTLIKPGLWTVDELEELFPRAIGDAFEPAPNPLPLS